MNYFDPDGYQSPTYGLTYYDGYGYNFYNGHKGYYEYSRPPIASTGPAWSPAIFMIYLACFSAVLLVFIFMQYYWLTSSSEDSEGQGQPSLKNKIIDFKAQLSRSQS